MPSWPATLPARPLAGSLQHDPYDPAIRQPAEIGPPMSRVRASIDFQSFSGSFVLNKDEYLVLKRFWKDECVFGTLTFDAVCWLENEPCQVKFLGRPRVEAHLGEQTLPSGANVSVYRVSVSVVRMPGT